MADEARVWLITGVSRGLGRELALAVLARGEVVVGTSRSGRADLNAGEHGGTLHLIPLDVSAPEGAATAVERAVSLCGRVDVLVNNAGAGLLGAVEEASAAEVAEVFEVNFFGPLRLMQAVLPGMRERRSGTIVNLSSIAGIAPMAGSGMYAAAKFALEGASKSLAQEVGPLGIRVMLVEPGAFRTDFLTDRSIQLSARRIDDYAETSGKVVGYLAGINGKQAGDPVRGAGAIIQAVDSPEPPLHLLLGTDALKRARAAVEAFGKNLDAWQDVATSTDFPSGH